MSVLLSFREKIKKRKYFYFFYVPLTFLFCVAGFLLLAYPEISGEGVTKGIKLCLNSLLPSLFPFMFLSGVIINLTTAAKTPKILNLISKSVFSLSGVSLIIIAFSLVGGYPVGASLVKKAFENGKITASEGKRMLLFCINPGPAFVISTVGSIMLGSKKAGVILYLSSLISSLILGVISRLFEDDDDLREYSDFEKEKFSVSSAVNDAANSTIHSMLNICAWVIFFSCLGALVEIMPISENGKVFIKIVSEVTNGCVVALENFPLPIVCAVIGFGGFCVHLQIMSAIIKLRLKLKYFYTFRLLAAALNCVVSMILFEMFPVANQTVALGSKPQYVNDEISVFVCAGLMLMCGLFVLGDSYVIKRRKSL